MAHLDKTMAAALGLEQEVSDSDLAFRLAELAEANKPDTAESERIWVELERSIEATLIQTPRDRLDEAEAAQVVVADVQKRTSESWQLWAEAFAGDSDGSTHDPERNPDTRLRRFIARTVAPALAEAGVFQLI